MVKARERVRVRRRARVGRSSLGRGAREIDNIRAVTHRVKMRREEDIESSRKKFGRRTFIFIGERVWERIKESRKSWPGKFNLKWGESRRGRSGKRIFSIGWRIET